MYKLLIHAKVRRKMGFTTKAQGTDKILQRTGFQLTGFTKAQVQILQRKFNRIAFRINEFQMDNARISQQNKVLNIHSEASIWLVFSFEEIHKICSTLVKPASYHEKIEKNTEADEMLRNCFKNNQKSLRRGMTTKRIRYYKIQRVNDDGDKITCLNPETWFKYRNVPWQEPVEDFQQILPEEERQTLYSLQSDEMIKTLGEYWWDSRFERGIYKQQLGEKIMREHGCFARYLIRTFQNNDPELDTQVAQRIYSDQLLLLIMDGLYLRMVEHKVSSTSITWFCFDCPGFIDFDFVRAMYYSNDCKDWFDLNEEDQCIQVKKRNHSRWSESTLEDSDEEWIRRFSRIPKYEQDLGSRTYENDWSSHDENFNNILNSEMLNEQVEKKEQKINRWIETGTIGYFIEEDKKKTIDEFRKIAGENNSIEKEKFLQSDDVTNCAIFKSVTSNPLQ